jgi:benzoyl-CoA reductase/2-hydroxyglutaryl-CoA dehydratase subunit BcrC/BadD/HgdB
MEAFDAFLQDGWALGAGPGPAPLVLQLCDFAPEELIRAVGARSVRLLSGCHQSAERASAEMPLDMCGAARAAAGELRRLLDGGVRPELVIVAATCDAQRRLAQWLAARTEVFVLEPPFVRDDAGLERWVRQIERLTQRLGRIAPLRRAGLRRAIEERNRRVWLSRQLRDLQRREAPPLHGLEAIRVFQAGQRMDPDLWRKEVEALLQARAGGGARPPGRARLLLAGSPSAWPDLKVPELIAQSGADLVADMTCAGGNPLSHPTVVDEDTLGGMVRAAAERTLLTCLCPIFSSLDERQDRLARLVEDFRVDGVIHHTLRLCLPSDGEIAALSAWCRERNLPFLSLRSDLGPEESGGLRNRLEAFLELIHSARGA